MSAQQWSDGIVLVLQHVQSTPGWRLYGGALRRPMGRRGDRACPASSLIGLPANDWTYVRVVPPIELCAIVNAADSPGDRRYADLRAALLAAAGLTEPGQ